MDKRMADALDRWLTTPPEDRYHLDEDDEMEYDLERCEICGELFRPNDERAEMYPPNPPANDGERDRWYGYDDNGLSLLVHAQCGLSRGWEVS